METFDVDGFPETKLALALFKSVKNATDLKRKHLHQVALIDSGPGGSSFSGREGKGWKNENQLTSAECSRQRRPKLLNSYIRFANRQYELVMIYVRACLAVRRMKYMLHVDGDLDRSLPSELVWSLSGSKNMSGSLETFCVQEVDNADMLVAAVGLGDENLRLVLEDVQGQPCALSELGQGLEEGSSKQSNGERDRFKKMYKITEEELALSTLEDCVVTRMAVKDH